MLNTLRTFSVSVLSRLSNQDPNQGFKLRFPSFKFQTKSQVRVSSCNFQALSFKPRSSSMFQVAIARFQDSDQDPGQGFKLQFPSSKIQTRDPGQGVMFDKHVSEQWRLFLWKQGFHVLITRSFYLSGSRSYHPSPLPIFNPSHPQSLSEDLYLG